MINIPIIVGPTSCGKTNLALNICNQTGWQIVSADSRQIYKYMDIGTGKVPVGENRKVEKYDQCWKIDDVTIWGYDLITPDKFYSSYDFAVFALNKINDLLKKKITPIVVGGTGFYIDVLTKRVNLQGVEPDFELRKKLEVIGTDDLLVKLKELNLARYNSIDRNNRARLVRAVEIELNKNSPPKTLPELSSQINYKMYGLTSDRPAFYARVDSWVDVIFSNGLIEETQSLLDRYQLSPKLSGLIYGSVVGYLTKKLSLTDALQRCKYDLHAYIRRQQTYFKKNPDILWFDISDTNSLKNLVLS